MRPLNSSRTACQVVGLGRPERFADGAATGVSHASKNAWATGCRGMRTPTVSNPAVTSKGTAACFGTITVNGPGKKCSIKTDAARGIRLAI